MKLGLTLCIRTVLRLRRTELSLNLVISTHKGKVRGGLVFPGANATETAEVWEEMPGNHARKKAEWSRERRKEPNETTRNNTDGAPGVSEDQTGKHSPCSDFQ